MPFKRNDEVLHVQTGPELVMLDVETGQYHHLNESASAIWSALGEPREVDQVCTLLRQEFLGDSQLMQAEVARFIGTLVHKKLLLEVPSGAS